MQSLKDYVVATIKPNEYYKNVFPNWNDRSRPNVNCLWHEDSKPSLSVALDRGGARCHACGKRIGNIVHFESEKEGISEEIAAANLYGKYIRPVFSVTTIGRYERNLTKFREWATTDCGLSIQSIARFHLGLDIKTYRITIPIKDRFGNYTNVRYYQLPRHRSSTTVAKIYNAEGFGYLELFPWQEFVKYVPSKPLFFMKAEKDTMLAIQMGLQAVCSTGGELAWNDEWNDHFKDFDIAICGDQDDTGKKASEKKFAILQSYAKSVSEIRLPFTRKSTKLKDFADWVLFDGGTRTSFLGLLDTKKSSSQLRIPPSEQKPELPDYYSNDYQDLISIGRNSDMLNHRVKIKAIVSAKTDRTYTIPYKFQVSSTSSPKREWTIPIGRELLRLIKTSDDQIIDFIKKELLGKDRKVRIQLEPMEYITVTEVEIIPVATVDEDAPYTTQKCFYFGKSIEANVPYELDIIPTTEIRSQETVGIITRTKTLSSSIDEFVFNKKVFAELDQFRSEGGVWNDLCNIANDFSSQFTRIYNRLDWHIVALLSWACPLQFNFPNEGVQRGWMNTLALGDTQTGKSQVCQAMQKIFNSGVFINAENCTYVGLVGGAVKMGSGQFMLRWGRIPLCNRQLVVIEELSGLSITEISNMSEVRSSGIARLDKGGLSSETSAKTRLICLSNVRGRDKNLAGYSSGVKAIQDLVGHGEDIARFDLIVTLTDGEVSSSVINQALFNQKEFDSLDASALQLLVKFIWALKPSQIEIPKETYIAILQTTKELGEKYHSSIPIFKPSAGRLKVARVATAIACFQFAWTGTRIVVSPEHVAATKTLLETLYDKESFGYKTYSEQLFYRDKIRSELELDATFNTAFTSAEKRERVLQYLIHAGRFTRDELCQVASIQIITADQVIGKMIGSNILAKGQQNVWDITPIGKLWMEKKLPKNGDKPSLNLNGSGKKLSKKLPLVFSKRPLLKTKTSSLMQAMRGSKSCKRQ